MHFVPTELSGIMIIEPTVHSDERGWFMESFHLERFYTALRNFGLPVPPPFVQDNDSLSKKGVVRGLHYQKAPHCQGKLVRVVRGCVYDVAVDIRKGSPTLGQHIGMELSAENQRMLWIPPGFAHGFLALGQHNHMQYKTTDYYAAESEASIQWNDPQLAINWPQIKPLTISPKDQQAPPFAAATLI